MAAALPPIIYGTAWKKAATQDLVVKAVLQGFTGIDTACQPKHYNEPAVGAALDELHSRHSVERASLYVQTKYTPLSGQDPASVPYDSSKPLGVQVGQSAAASLKNLRCKYLDCLLLHSPLPNHRDMMDVWRGMETEVSAGRVLSLGISNCYSLPTLQKLWSEAAVKPRVLQNRRAPSSKSKATDV
jgi:diketogulonate reductase-like aldo/keto reductase